MNISRWLLAASLLSVWSCGPGKTMSVDRKPVAEFKLTQSTVRPQVFVFDAAQSRATVGSLAKFRWTFGDETAGAAPTEVPGSTAQHAYKMAGTFTVTLVVLDDKDTESDPVTKEVTVSSVNTAGPMANISGPSSGMAGATLTFDGSGSTPSGDIQNFEWDFGDSSSVSSGKDKTIVQHAFAADGRFTVKLTVTDSLGANATATLQVQVGSPGPLAVCSFTPTSGITQGAQVMFSGSQSTVPTGSMIQAYVWDFGDGTNNIPGNVSMGGAVAHAYASQGTFTPKLKIFDNSAPPRSHETTCPAVVVGAASLCSFMYQWQSTGNNGGLGCSLSEFSSTTMSITQNANGTIVLSEPYMSTMLLYNGTWSGVTFTATGQGTAMGVTIQGTFSNGCNAWTGTYADALCTHNVSATKL